MNVDAVGLYEIAEEFNSIIRDVFRLVPLVAVVLIDAVFICGCIVHLAEFLKERLFKK